MKKISIILVALTVIICIFSCKQKQSQEEIHAAISKEAEKNIVAGAKAPEFTLKNLKDETVNLSDFRGKVVVLTFWAYGAQSYEFEELIKLNKMIKGKDIQIVTILMFDSQKSSAEAFLKEIGFEQPTLIDRTNGEYTEITELYGLTYHPTTFIIDKSGLIVKRFSLAKEIDNKKYLEISENVKQLFNLAK